MAISAPHYELFKRLHDRNQLPEGGRILEVGEANFYGDMPTDQIVTDIRRYLTGYKRNAALGRLSAAIDASDLWEVAKVIYDIFVDPAVVCSVDLDGTPAAAKHDLNQQCGPPGVPFDLVINHGTAEHIFNIANVFRFMHDSTAAGGLMIHESPFIGWVDHGFYTLQPTMYYDVAAANRYEMVMLAIEQINPRYTHEIKQREEIHALAADGELPPNAMLYVAMRRTDGEPFKIPMQGVYARSVSDAVQRSWRALR